MMRIGRDGEKEAGPGTGEAETVIKGDRSLEGRG